jgi:lysophospholipase L1-like esterase
VPSWAVDRETRPLTVAALNANAKVVAAARGPFDFVLWGDSITDFIHMRAQAAFDRAFGGNAVALGVGGNTVEELAGRLMRGREKPRWDPRVAALLVGINNLNWSKTEPAEKLEYLLTWMRAVMPTTKIIVMGLLPCTRVDVRSVNERYRALAAKLGCTYVDCGAGMSASDTRYFVDGTHPSAAGYDRVFACLRPVVQQLRGG